jgi:hypothetical protein
MGSAVAAEPRADIGLLSGPVNRTAMNKSLAGTASRSTP